MWRRAWALVRRTVAIRAVLALLCGAYFWLSTPLPTPRQLRERAALGSTRIVDRRGQLLFTLADPLGGYHHPVALADVPIALRQATIAVEDAAFYQHPGVDLRGILRALWTNLRAGQLRAGGSTITQQLAQNFLLDPALSGQSPRQAYRPALGGRAGCRACGRGHRPGRRSGRAWGGT